MIEKLHRCKSRFVTYPATIILGKQIFRSFYRNTGISWQGKKSCLVLSFDCDYSADVKAIPGILDKLAKTDIKASFACVGLFIKKYPKIHKRIVDEGHEILNHTYSHPNNDELGTIERFNDLSFKRIRNEIEKFHETCKELVDYEPTGFRIPHFGPLYTDKIYPVLHDLGYKYSSSTIALRTPKRGLPYYQNDVLEIPVSPCPEHPFGIFDTYHSFSRSRFSWHRKDFMQTFDRLLLAAVRTGNLVNVYFDPQDIKFFDFEGFLSRIRDCPDIWITTYDKLAKWWKDETVSVS
ncbi:MAG: polysaccharide deacetylase family protein [archaeon]